jgi:hypothetical protein
MFLIICPNADAGNDPIHKRTVLTGLAVLLKLVAKAEGGCSAQGNGILILI